ncbi:MAG: hypothetical protein JXR52_03440 [Bacteroidales bacterium]|nr:hypothetical protein [Bacteroidales bacterium]
MKLPGELIRIINDRESGSAVLTGKLVFVLRKLALNPAIQREQFRSCMVTVQREMDRFAAVVNLCGDLLIRLEPPFVFPSTVLKYLDDYELFWASAPEKIALNLKHQIELNNKTFLTHSHSGTILSVLEKLKENGTIFRIFQTVSIPGCEGLLSKKKIAGMGIESVLVHDEDVEQVLYKTDGVLVGCDTLLEDRFLNKKGTGRIAELALKYKIPFLVLTESRKRPAAGTGANRIKEHPLFEWTSLDLVSALVTEQQPEQGKHTSG